MEDLTKWERRVAETFARLEFGEGFAHMDPLAGSGYSEFYVVEA